MAVMVSDLVAAVRDTETVRYSEIASSTIVVLDHLITLDEEIRYIWSGRWTTGKCLFFFSRYYGLANVIFNNYALFATTVDDPVSRAFFQWQGWTGLVSVISAEITLQLRLYALYSLNPHIIVSMVICFVAVSVISAVIMANALIEFVPVAHLFPGQTFCVPLNMPRDFYAFWIPILLFESMLCAMAIYRGFSTYQFDRGVYRTGQTIIYVLLRDSLIYFLLIFSIFFMTLLVWYFGASSILEAPVGFAVAMPFVLSNRLILNVRAMSSAIEHGDFNSAAEICSPVAFVGGGDGGSPPALPMMDWECEPPSARPLSWGPPRHSCDEGPEGEGGCARTKRGVGTEFELRTLPAAASRSSRGSHGWSRPRLEIL
ncbi:hypothetical protein PLICRDRAFT_701710 [Plicaturopsis crispa FD-325 SS-3]|uniref:DUF6533 domain-containing protein n=1 Tax=Plicaturopsis crispa FD-325 SS-3 TaxID=944288 RepID=A0A0C9SKY2_PLICR|nr:hypothetical protein PLICRDRAFT_701710 [Plicaturopsis crispa FD-325 SS-3]